jgi:hypothetical protein
MRFAHGEPGRIAFDNYRADPGRAGREAAEYQDLPVPTRVTTKRFLTGQPANPIPDLGARSEVG